MSYQFIIFEPDERGRAETLIKALRAALDEINPDLPSLTHFPKGEEIERKEATRFPRVGVYFGGSEPADTATRARITALLKQGITIIPVVDQLDRFRETVPAELYDFNGFPLDSTTGDFTPLVNRLLEAQTLLRRTRRLFISYKRSDSRDVALQLYEMLNQKGFDVFLDTVSIDPGAPFQAALEHRLVDGDVMILLHTTGFLNSEWTKNELLLAYRRRVSILRLEWPDVTRRKLQSEDPSEEEKILGLLESINILENDITAQNTLRDPICDQICAHVESRRAQALARRRNGLTKAFIDDVQLAGFSVQPHPEQFLILKRKNKATCAVLPAVGAPTAYNYYDFQTCITRIGKYSGLPLLILYDHVALLDQHQKHLEWLDRELRSVRGLRLVDARSVLSRGESVRSWGASVLFRGASLLSRRGGPS